jgi:hypothetical protein
MKGRIGSCWWMATALVMGCASASSGGNGGGTDTQINKDVVYDPPVNLDHWTYAIQRTDGSTQAITARVAGTKIVGGQTFARLQVGTLPTMANDPNADYIEVWALPQGTAVVFAGGEIHNKSLNLPAGTPDVTLTVNPPVTIETNIAVNEPQAITATGTVLIGDPATAQPVTGTQTGTFKLVSKAETVDTGVGTQTGAAHYAGEVTVMGQKASGDLWTVSGLGVVKASGGWPGMPGVIKDAILGLTGSGGQTMDGDHTVASQESTLGPGHTQFKLDTYDIDGGLFADKNTHANMLLELRWADPTLAKSATPPPVTTEFGTAIGYFPSQQVDSPVSVLHPEENGLGYHYWTTLVNQAAKNEPGGPETSYHIKANYTGSSGDVRATAQLNYHSLKP